MSTPAGLPPGSLAARVLYVLADGTGYPDTQLAGMLAVTPAELSPVIGMLYRRGLADRCGPCIVASAAIPRRNGTSGTSGTRARQSPDPGFRAPAQVPEPTEPSPVRHDPQEDTAMEVPLERRVFAASAGPGRSRQAFGRGSGSEAGLTQNVDNRPALSVDQRVGVPGQRGVIHAPGADHPVVVHQRDAGLLSHAPDGSRLAPQRELQEAALRCAARGWHVFPIRPRAKKPPAFPDHKAADCTGTDLRCRSEHQGWEPRATADPGRISRGWARTPYNIGIATGPSDLVVIDLDTPKPGEAAPPQWALPGITDGADVLAALCERHGQDFPWETFMVRTRRGGLHLYFTAPPGIRLGNTSGRSERGLGWLIDTRAHGGYVVAPGSFVDLPDGTGRYELVYDRPPAPLPGWLAALLNTASREPPLLECRPSHPGQVRDLGSYVRTALYGECERVRTAAIGGRSHALNKAAYNLGGLVAAGALPEDVAERELTVAASVHATADPPFTAAEARAVIRGGITAGRQRPRLVTGAAA